MSKEDRDTAQSVVVAWSLVAIVLSTAMMILLSYVVSAVVIFIWLLEVFLLGASQPAY